MFFFFFNKGIHALSARVLVWKLFQQRGVSPVGPRARRDGRLAFAQLASRRVSWRQGGSGTCFHMKIKTAQEEKHNIAQSDPECQNCNNREFSPKAQAGRAVIARLVCPHRGRQERGQRSSGSGQMLVTQPRGAVPWPLPCQRPLPPTELPKA